MAPNDELASRLAFALALGGTENTLRITLILTRAIGLTRLEHYAIGLGLRRARVLSCGFCTAKETAPSRLHRPLTR